MEGTVHARGSGSGEGRGDLVPKRFVWPHGGRKVFLTGSFTRWCASIPMSPVEGCPNVFQVTCSLLPGHHQYKFNVDGEWRHDDQQQVMSGNYGVVNTIYLVREPDISPAILSAERPGRADMEIDNYGHVEVNPRILESDLQVSRHRLSVFLSTHTASELLPESGKVIALDTNLPLMDAFHILYEERVSKAPLWDSSKIQFVGVLSSMDFILLLKEGKQGLNLSIDKLETHTIAAWEEGKLQLCGTDSKGRTYPQNFVHAGPNECLKDVTIKILQNKVSIVPIIHSSPEDGSSPQLLHLASLTGILKCICRHFKHNSLSLPILQLPTSSIPLGTWMPKIGESDKQPLAMLKPNASLGAALSLLIQAKVSSIPIVDDNVALLGIYSRSDIIALVKDKAYAGMNLDEFSIQQAMVLGQDLNSPYGLRLSERCHICLKSDSLHLAMEQLANNEVRRLVVVEAGSKCVEGIISIGDVFRFLLG